MYVPFTSSLSSFYTIHLTNPDIAFFWFSILKRPKKGPLPKRPQRNHKSPPPLDLPKLEMVSRLPNKPSFPGLRLLPLQSHGQITSLVQQTQSRLRTRRGGQSHFQIQRLPSRPGLSSSPTRCPRSFRTRQSGLPHQEHGLNSRLTKKLFFAL